MTGGIAEHPVSKVGRTDDWLTPPGLLNKLGHFHLDPACPPSMPWTTAERMLTPVEDGLSCEWAGRVWLNPPYSAVGTWLDRMAKHGNGISLTFARTDTEWFSQNAFSRADAFLFIRGRLRFYQVDGVRARKDPGAPSVLLAYGEANVRALEQSGIAGAFFRRCSVLH